jgi:hypothetical protein
MSNQKIKTNGLKELRAPVEDTPRRHEPMVRSKWEPILHRIKKVEIFIGLLMYRTIFREVRAGIAKSGSRATPS